MAATNGQLAASGLGGAVASLIVNATTIIVPDNNFKSTISLVSGVVSSFLVFEAMSWWVIVRLKRQRSVINSLIPSLESLQSAIESGVNKQIENMKTNNASSKSIDEIRKLRSESYADIAKTLIEIQRINIEIVKNINK